MIVQDEGPKSQEAPPWVAAWLSVPYVDRNDAKALGARWSPDRKQWYVPVGTSTRRFRQWPMQIIPRTHLVCIKCSGIFRGYHGHRLCTPCFRAGKRIEAPSQFKCCKCSNLLAKDDSSLTCKACRRRKDPKVDFGELPTRDSRRYVYQCAGCGKPMLRYPHQPGATCVDCQEAAAV